MIQLEMRNVIKSFDGFNAIDRLDFSVNAGELHCLIGANGAGKSTTLDLICGKYEPTSGTVFFDGLNITRAPEHKRARFGIGRKFQVPSVFRNLTVVENLEIADSQKPHPWQTTLMFGNKAKKSRIEEIVELVGLQDHLNKMAGVLSHGETQWLEIAMLLMQDSKLILMDEPTAGMTSHETSKTSKIFNRLRGQHTLVVVEHDMTFVREIAEIITVLHLGKALAQGTVKEIESDPQVKEAYLGSGGLGNA